MEAGSIVGNRYELMDILGSGGMGRVYLARNLAIGTFWAIKEIIKVPGKLDCVFTEVDVLKNLEHPMLPKVFDVIETAEAFYVVFTYIKGISLSRKLTEEGSFDENTVLKWGISLCDVLSYLHSLTPNPIIYRDMKPSNIMVCDDGSLRLIDFGIAREYKEEKSEDTVFIGTRGYAAPEQYGQGQSGPYTDIFSLGVTLKQLLTGKSPITLVNSSESFSKSHPQISKRLCEILDKCTQEEVDKRYADASQLREDLIALSIKKEKRTVKFKNANVIIKTEKKIFYKQLIISLDNAEFTAELAVAASRAGMKVLLVDVFRLTPVCDFYLGIQDKYIEHRIMTGLDAESMPDLKEKDSMDKYIYAVPHIEGLSYLTISITALNNENSSSFLSNMMNHFDLVIMSSSIKFAISCSGTLLNSADKILITDKINFDRVDYWNRIISSAAAEFGLKSEKVTYIGWLYEKSDSTLLKLAGVILERVGFIRGISFKADRYKNINNSKESALLNYKGNKKEYDNLLFNLNISPAGFIDNSSGGLLRFLCNRGC